LSRDTPYIQRSRFSVRLEFSKRFRYMTLEKSPFESSKIGTFDVFEGPYTEISKLFKEPFVLPVALLFIPLVEYRETGDGQGQRIVFFFFFGFSFIVWYFVYLHLLFSPVCLYISFVYVLTLFFSRKFCIFSDTRDKRVCMCVWEREREWEACLIKNIYVYIYDESVIILWDWSVKIQSLLYLMIASFFSFIKSKVA